MKKLLKVAMAMLVACLISVPAIGVNKTLDGKIGYLMVNKHHM